MQQPILEEAGHFNVAAVDTSTLAPEEGTSAFVWRVEAADETLYIIQVVLFCTILHDTNSDSYLTVYSLY